MNADKSWICQHLCWRLQHNCWQIAYLSTFMSFGQIHIKAGLLAGLKRVCGRVCPDTMKVGFKRVFAATGGAPLNRLPDTTNLGADAGLDSPPRKCQGKVTTLNLMYLFSKQKCFSFFFRKKKKHNHQTHPSNPTIKHNHQTQTQSHKTVYKTVYKTAYNLQHKTYH